MPLDTSKIQALMVERSVSRKEVSARTGIKLSNIYRVLSGKHPATLETAEKLAVALECGLDDIVTIAAYK